MPRKEAKGYKDTMYRVNEKLHEGAVLIAGTRSVDGRGGGVSGVVDQALTEYLRAFAKRNKSKTMEKILSAADKIAGGRKAKPSAIKQ